MRRIAIITLAILSGICAMAQGTAQGQLNDFRNSTPPPYKDDLKSVPSKTIKVVLLNDNTLTDALLKDAIEKGWYISPYEFITTEDFDKVKTDTSSFFILRAGKNAGWKEDSGMDYLSFKKGHPDAEKDLSKLTDIITLPLSADDDIEGKALPFIPAYISIIQKHIEKVMEKSINAYRGMTMYNDIFSDGEFGAAYFSDGDFAFDVNQDKLSKDSKGRAKFVTAEEMEELLDNPAPNTLYSLVLSPADPNLGSSNAYQMLICPDTGELIYYHKHRITKNKPAGFSKIEYLSILKYFK